MSDDKKPLEVPDFLHAIPQDEDPDVQEFMRAQALIQAAFHTYGDPAKGAAVVSRDDLYSVLGVALALLASTDPRADTPRDLRLLVEAQAKVIIGYAKGLRESGDMTAETILRHLGIAEERLN